MNYQQATTQVYNEFPDYFDTKFGAYTNEIIKEELNEILSLLPPNSKLLDLGSGPGNHALFFQQKGFDVLCVDISDAMLKKCSQKGLTTLQMDMKNLNLPPHSFDIVWAYTSILHLPKHKVPALLEKIHTVLKDKGLFCISLKERNEEGMFDFEKGGQRWFSLYTDQEIRKLISPKFEVIKNWRVPVSDKVFLDISVELNN